MNKWKQEEQLKNIAAARLSVLTSNPKNASFNSQATKIILNYV